MASFGYALFIASGIGYIIALIFPFGLAVVFTAIVYFAFIAISHLDVIFSLYFLGFVAVGFIPASIVRAVSKQLYQRKTSLFIIIVVQVLGAMFIPAVYKGPVIYWEIRDGTLFGTPNYDNVTFLLDGKRITTPGFHIVNAFCAFGKNGQQLIHLYLDDQNKKRQFCGEFNNGDRPISVESVEFRFAQLNEVISHPRFLSLCNAAGWPNDLCLFKANSRKPPENYPSKLTLIDKSELQSLLMKMKWDENYYTSATTTEKLENLEVNNFKFNKEAFDWINKVYDQDDINFYLLNCSKTTMLSCMALERTSNKTFIYYSFVSNVDGLNNDAKNIHLRMNDFVNIISK